MQRIFRRRAGGSPGRRRFGLLSRRSRGDRLPWGRKAKQQPPAEAVAAPAGHDQPVELPAGAAAGKASFKDRGKLRRRLRFLRRARELAYRDIGGLIFDMRRFGRNRQDLLDAKLGALGAVDQELRALEHALEDRRPIHELREPGISSCPRCGALHDSEANFCPHCGLQLGGPRAMGEVGGAIASPPQAPATPTAATRSAAPPEQQTQTLRPPDAP
ncbi:MAG TPA: zinc ribbon domain-containing protein [Solirubrobacteraceae bacterium]|nr:zinc ribbon domain-containing protein [Solirubrobacteraceae bacterium]